MNFDLSLYPKFWISIFWIPTLKSFEIGFSVLFSTAMLIFMIFDPRLLPQLSEKRDKKQKLMKKWKTACETMEGCNVNGFDSWGRQDIRFYSWWTKIRLLWFYSWEGKVDFFFQRKSSQGLLGLDWQVI